MYLAPKIKTEIQEDIIYNHMKTNNLRQLTEAEKASLIYRYFYKIRSYEIPFAIAFPEKYARYSAQTLKASVSHWKNSPEVKEFESTLIETDKARLKKQINELYNKETKQAGNRPETGKENEAGNSEKITLPEDWINFQDITEFLKFCEIQANNLTDEKERQFYLKTISDLLRYKETETGTEEIQRFYTPVQCGNCPLYSQEASNLLE